MFLLDLLFDKEYSSSSELLLVGNAVLLIIFDLWFDFKYLDTKLNIFHEGFNFLSINFLYNNLIFCSLEYLTTLSNKTSQIVISCSSILSKISIIWKNL